MGVPRTLFALSSALLLACGPIAGPSGERAGPEQVQPQRGGIFHYATSTRLAAGVDPHDYRGTSANHVLYLAYDYLVTLNARLTSRQSR